MFDPKWNETYPLSWCEQCYVATITCPTCKNSSCNGSGCSQCIETFKEFAKGKIQVENYLTEEEIAIYHKSLRIKHFILRGLEENRSQIDWHLRQLPRTKVQCH